MEQHIVVVDQTASLLRSFTPDRSWTQLTKKFSVIFQRCLLCCAVCLANVSLSCTSAAENISPKLTSIEPGRPASSRVRI